jgi:hypothetical protein
MTCAMRTPTGHGMTGFLPRQSRTSCSRRRGLVGAFLATSPGEGAMRLHRVALFPHLAPVMVGCP